MDNSQYIIQPNGTLIPIDNAASFEDAKVAAGMEMAEVIYLKNGKVMLVDEDGHLKRLLPNPIASSFAGEPIVGPVVVANKDILN